MNRGVLENLAKFTENPLYWSLFLIKFQPSSPQRYFKKETPAWAFSYEFCKIFKNATGRLLVFFTISREVSHYAFLSGEFFIKTLLMKIFEDIYAMPVAKE